MRQRFRIKNQFFAAETVAIADRFEARVFLLHPDDSYFRQEEAEPVVRLSGSDEQELVRQAILATKACLERSNEEK